MPDLDAILGIKPRAAQSKTASLDSILFGDTPAAKVRTRALDEQGIDSAEVKRRAADGEEIVQSGLRAGSPVERGVALGIEGVTGAAEGIGGLVGLAGDVVTAPVRGAIGAAQTPGGYGAKVKGSLDAILGLPATRTATAAADDLRKTARELTGVDGVEIGPTGDVVRFGADVLMPGPEVVGAVRQIKGASKVADNLVDDAVPPPAAIAEPEAMASGGKWDATPPAPEAPAPKPKVEVVGDAPTLAESGKVNLKSPDDPWGRAIPAVLDDQGRAHVAESHWEAATKLGLGQGENFKIAPERQGWVVDGQYVTLDDLDAHQGDLRKFLDEKAAPPPKPPAGPPASDVTVPPDDGDLPKYARPSAINLERLNTPDEVRRFINDTAQGDTEALSALKGETLTADEVIAAQSKARLLTDPVTRETTEALAADMLKSRNALVEMAKTGKVTPEYLELQRAVSTHATNFGRLLASLGIRAGDESAVTAMRELTERMEEMGKTADEIVKELEGVDFTNAAQAQKAFDTKIKPKFGEIIDAYRYANLLSSPKTHIVNITSNWLQAGILRPADRTMAAMWDGVSSKFTGKEREHFASLPAYFKGQAAALPKAWKAAVDAFTGKAPMTHLDMQRSSAASRLPPGLRHISRFLEAQDKFFMTVIEGGEYAALADGARKAGQTINEVEIAKRAEAVAKELTFRKPLDPKNETGQGHILSVVDRFSGGMQAFLDTKVGNTRPGRWVVPFIQTPMNILKQGLEHTPMGYATMWGATDKATQAAKATTGSLVFMGAGMLAMQDRTTWGVPKGEKDKQAFLATKQPYSVKLGDTWVSYQRLGPLAFPIALAAAMKHYSEDAPTADGFDADAIAKGVAAMIPFFGRQSYMEQIGNLMDAVTSEQPVSADVIANFPKQLIPLVSLQRWITSIVDPVYRKAGKSLGRNGLRNVLQQLQKDIPGLSDDLPAHKGPDGKPAQRKMAEVNAVSPVEMRPAGTEKEENRWQRRKREAQRRERKRQKKED
jgi:hypothetical protein